MSDTNMFIVYKLWTSPVSDASLIVLPPWIEFILYPFINIWKYKKHLIVTTVDSDSFDFVAAIRDLMKQLSDNFPLKTVSIYIICHCGQYCLEICDQ